jgi:pimeloyl-ACP methyl ester carboxylesterase
LEGIGLVDEPLDEAVRRVSDWVVSVRRARARRPRAYPTVEAAAERLLEVDPKTSRELARFLAVHGTRRTDDGWVFKHDALHLTRGPNVFRLDQARTFWRAVRCPVLLVDGAESELQHLPDLTERYAMFDKGRRVTVPGAGHMMIRHRPAEVAEALAGFFGEGAA